MATANSTAKAKRPAARPRVKAGELMAAYGVPDGVLSFRHGLRARERGTIDRALAILGRVLCEREVFSTPDAVKHYLQLHLAGEMCEHFGALYLDSQNRLIAFEHHFTGTLTQTSIYPREVVRAALGHHAAAVVLCHNHPSGTVTPSRADEALTQTLKAALSLVDVRVLDHVIVAPGQALSMAERGLI
jgi:DNA repair protein RadC